jgi:hypothetical protein
MRIRIALLCLLFLAFAACGEDQYAPRGKSKKEAKPTEVTGLLLNAQQAEKNVDAAERRPGRSRTTPASRSRAAPTSTRSSSA